MPPPEEEGFSFDDVAKADKAWLKRAASQIRWHQRRNTSDFLAIGRVLIQARRRLKNKVFGNWVAQEVGVRPRTAARLQRVARVFGTLPREVIDRIDYKALGVLAADNIPEETLKWFRQQAEDGQRVTFREVSEALKSQRDQSPAPLKLASKDEKKEVEADRVHAADNWFLLCDELRAGATINMNGLLDEGNPTTYSFYRITAEGKRTSTVHRTPEAALLAITATVRTKVCDTCGKPQPLDDFYNEPKSRDGDGLGQRCRKCECKRVKEYEQRRKKAELAKLKLHEPDEPPDKAG